MTSQLIAVLPLLVAVGVGCATPGPSVTRGGTEYEPALGRMVATEDLVAISHFKEAWERAWGTDWVLKSVRQDSIDHFLSGYVLEWERVEAQTRVVRLDAFTGFGCFYSAHETYYQSGREAARGHL